ncbi:hypothetical protein [Methylocaldum marinum]|uniref:hypothetical protein n=1 Tax=Methylocaldum marinum TaxID=1432792 RepID=UPI0011AE383F|nr:hypothetical protein [Methylocaldum marinum]
MKNIYGEPSIAPFAGPNPAAGPLGRQHLSPTRIRPRSSHELLPDHSAIIYIYRSTRHATAIPDKNAFRSMFNMLIPMAEIRGKRDNRFLFVRLLTNPDDQSDRTERLILDDLKQ